MVFVFVCAYARASYFVIPAKAGIQFLSCHSDESLPIPVIPAEAGIHLLWFLIVGAVTKPDSRPCELPSHPCEGVTFSCLCKRK